MSFLMRWAGLVLFVGIIGPILWVALIVQVPFRDPQEIEEQADKWGAWLRYKVAKGLGKE